MGTGTRTNKVHWKLIMKFSIRDLMLVTVIVALAFGWKMDHQFLGATISDQSWKVEAFEGAANFLGFDSTVDDNGIVFEATSSRQNYNYSFRISKDGHTMTALPDSEVSTRHPFKP
jgi:hypothetical protein